jgi:hypothetical protein
MDRVFRLADLDEVTAAINTVDMLRNADLISASTHERAIEEIGFRLAECRADGERT